MRTVDSFLVNGLTLSRIFLAFLLVYLIRLEGFQSAIIALIIFILASLTDLFDGILARKKGVVTLFGKLMDPIADKVLTLLVFFALVWEGWLPFWLVMVIAVREVLITLIRLSILDKGVSISAGWMGKLKTVLQISLIIWALLLRSIQSLGYESAVLMVSGVTFIIALVTMAITLISGGQYLVQFQKTFTQSS